MNYYLKGHNSQLRIIQDWVKFDQMIVATDFDSTICPWHPHEGDHNNEVIGLLRELKEVCGCYLILFTANKHPDKALEWCQAKGIDIDMVNDNAPVALDYFTQNEYPEPPRKIYFNVLLDDKSGLQQTYNELRLLIDLVKLGLIKKQYELV